MASSDPTFVIEPLTKAHVLDQFDCGTASLTEWLRRFALTNHQSGSARTYVAHRRDDVVVGYHSLTASSVARADAPERIAKGLPTQPIGVVLLARLAVDSRHQGNGLGKALLRDARCKEPPRLLIPSGFAPCSFMRLTKGQRASIYGASPRRWTRCI